MRHSFYCRREREHPGRGARRRDVCFANAQAEDEPSLRPDSRPHKSPPNQLDLILRPLPNYTAGGIAAAAPHLHPPSAPPPLGVVVALPAATTAAAAVRAAAALLDATGAGFALAYGVSEKSIDGAVADDRIALAAHPPTSIGDDLERHAGLCPASIRPALPPAAECGPNVCLCVAEWRSDPPFDPATLRHAPPAARALYAPRLADRNATPRPRDTALIIIDAQNYSCRPASPLWAGREKEGAYFFDRLNDLVGPNWRALVAAARACKRGRGPRGSIPIIYTVMASPADDGARGVCGDYVTSGFHIPARSWDAAVVSYLAPRRGDIVLAKGSCNAFASSSLEHALRSLGVKHCVVVGVMADQCVSAAAATAADLNFGVTYVVDATATGSAVREEAARASMAGFCRLAATDQVLEEWRE